jgi:hypothetical protein
MLPSVIGSVGWSKRAIQLSASSTARLWGVSTSRAAAARSIRPRTTKLRPHLITNVQRGAALEHSMEYTVTAAFLLAVVTGSFAIVILGGYEIAQLVASAL